MNLFHFFALIGVAFAMATRKGIQRTRLEQLDQWGSGYADWLLNDFAAEFGAESIEQKEYISTDDFMLFFNIMNGSYDFSSEQIMQIVELADNFLITNDLLAQTLPVLVNGFAKDIFDLELYRESFLWSELEYCIFNKENSKLRIRSGKLTLSACNLDAEEKIGYLNVIANLLFMQKKVRIMNLKLEASEYPNFFTMFHKDLEAASFENCEIAVDGEFMLDFSSFHQLETFVWKNSTGTDIIVLELMKLPSRLLLLDLSLSDLGNHAQAVGSLLLNQPDLEILRLLGNNLNESESVELVEIIVGLLNLRQLDLTYSPIGGALLNCLASGTINVPWNVLYLRNCGLDAKNFNLEAFYKMPQLENLDLADNLVTISIEELQQYSPSLSMLEIE